MLVVVVVVCGDGEEGCKSTFSCLDINDFAFRLAIVK